MRVFLHSFPSYKCSASKVNSPQLNLEGLEFGGGHKSEKEEDLKLEGKDVVKPKPEIKLTYANRDEVLNECPICGKESCEHYPRGRNKVA